MSTATLSGLLEYLYGTLSPGNMRWVGEHLIEHAQKEEKEEEALRPYTMEEINTMLDEAEADFDAGLGIPHEEVMRKWKERLARKEQFEMAEAV